MLYRQHTLNSVFMVSKRKQGKLEKLDSQGRLMFHKIQFLKMVLNNAKWPRSGLVSTLVL